MKDRICPTTGLACDCQSFSCVIKRDIENSDMSQIIQAVQKIALKIAQKRIEGTERQLKAADKIAQHIVSNLK